MLKIATWNVNGIRARGEQVQQWLEQEAPDVACLQEIKATPAQVPPALLDLPGYQGFWHGGKGGYSGVALLVRKDHWAEPLEFVHPPFDMENRMVAAQVDDMTVASIYVPNGGKDLGAKMRFLEELIVYARGFAKAGKPLVLTGDFNVAHREIDVHPKERREVIGQSREERELIDELLATGLVDVGRALAPKDDGLFTWWAPWRKMRERNIGWRLDYIYASAGLAAKAQACTVGRETGTSDHGPVVATFG